ncbi:MAG: NAD(P)-dependent oxidoreductase, partial [Chloroflexota bacterium]
SILWAGRQRRWENRMEMRRVNRELTGMTAGLIGFGGTGTAIARRAGAFGMKCVAVDPVVTEADGLADWLGKPERLREMARHSEVLFVCCPLTPETRNRVDSEIIHAMPAGGYVINVTRGGIVNEDALYDALHSGHLAGAGLDVTSQEPLPDDSPLWELDNVIITPHTAGASQHRIPRIQDRVIKNIENLANGKPLEGVIDKRKGY